jgi:hypothetical protein
MMTEPKNNCLICGEELVYKESLEARKCQYCGLEFESQAACVNGHFICDTCHASPAIDIIRRSCLHSPSVNPVRLATGIMKHPSVKMHGPEHHFLVPAVLLSCYYNQTGHRDQLEEKLSQAEKRSVHILGGFCGSHGSCGAAVGTGIFMSLATGSTPLSTNGWRQSNLITAQSLMSVALHGGPRCCKRDTYLSLDRAVDFIEKEQGVSLEKEENISCEFSHLNKQCLLEECQYYPG